MVQEQEPEGRTPDRSAKLKDVERLLALWQSLQGGDEDPSASLPLRHPDQVATHLEALRIGPAPESLHEAIRQIWNSHQRCWASRSDSAALRQRLQEVAASPGRDLEDLEDLEEGLAVRRERLTTLRLLCDVLDELIQSRDDLSSGADPATSTIGPGDETRKGIGEGL